MRWVFQQPGRTGPGDGRSLGRKNIAGAGAPGFRFRRRAADLSRNGAVEAPTLFRDTGPAATSRPAGQTARHREPCADTRFGLLIRMTPCPGVHRGDGDARPENCQLRPVGKGQRPDLQDRFFATPDHRAIDGPRHGFMQILTAMVEGCHEDAPRQAARSDRLVPIVRSEIRVNSTRPLRNADQGGVAAEKRASHGEDRLDFDVARGPMADDP